MIQQYQLHSHSILHSIKHKCIHMYDVSINVHLHAHQYIMIWSSKDHTKNNSNKKNGGLLEYIVVWNSDHSGKLCGITSGVPG